MHPFLYTHFFFFLLLRGFNFPIITLELGVYTTLTTLIEKWSCGCGMDIFAGRWFIVVMIIA